MRTYLDCIPCFFVQALKAARITGADENMQKKILDEVSNNPKGRVPRALPVGE